MTSRQLILSFTVLLVTSSTAFGEAQCPGNVETIRYHSLSHSQIAIPVAINRSGPYEFLVDTGAQITIVEPSLAAELHLQAEAEVNVVSDVRRAKVDLVTTELIEAGGHAVSRPMVAVQSLAQIQLANPGVRGILGENFLAHFDLLIDYGHAILCLDETKQMQGLRGERIPLVVKPEGEWDSPFPQPLLVSVQLSEKGSRGMILRLDSGANLPQLYVNQLETAPWVQRQNALRGHVSGKAAEFFALTPPQDVRIGRQWLRDIVFATPLKTGRNVAFQGEDGLLPTGLFKRVFISHTSLYVIFDPK